MNFKRIGICAFILISALLMGSCKENSDLPGNAPTPGTDALSRDDLDKVAAIRLFTMDYEHGDSLVKYSRIDTHSGGVVVASDVFSSLVNIVTIRGNDARELLKTAEYAEGIIIYQSSQCGNIILDDETYLDITVFNGDQGFKINGAEGYYSISRRDLMDKANNPDLTHLLPYHKLILPTITPEAVVFSFEGGASWSAPCNDKGEITARDLFEVAEYMYEENLKLLKYQIDAAGSLALLYEDALYNGVFIKWDAELETITELVYMR